MPDLAQATIDEVRQYGDRRPCNMWHSPPPALRWLEKRFGWHLCLSAETC